MADPPDPPDPPDIDLFPSSSEITSFQRDSRKRANVTSIDNIYTNKKIVTKSLAVPSIQNVYTHSNIDLSKQYSSKDKGPFLVHVSLLESDPSAGSSIRPIIFGKFLYSNKIKNIAKDGIKKIGRNKISITFSSASDANNFVNNQLLTKHNYKAFIPNYNITRMGVVRGVPAEWSMDEFVESLELPEECGIVLKARRLNRKKIVDGAITWLPTLTVVITFEGQFLPDRVFSFHTSLKVEPYYYPTIQCVNCCRFGHIKSQCRSKPRCYKCAEAHTGESCESAVISCVNCSGHHFANNNTCPEFLRQKSIKMVMSQDKLSYPEAAQRFNPSQPSYAQVCQKNVTLPLHLSRQSSQSSSYTKTTYKTCSPRPSLDLGYDKQAHREIISNVLSCLPNGFALQNSKEQNSQNRSSSNTDNKNDDLSNLLLLLFINIFSKFSDCLPPNAASLINTLNENLNYDSRSTMEH